MSICQSQTPYDQDLLPNLTWVTSVELQVGSDDDKQAIQGKLAECKRCKVKLQEEAQLAEEAQLEAERQEQAWLEEERVCTEAEAQRLEAACRAEEARKAEQSQWLYETYIKEHFEFLVPDLPSDWDTTDEEDKDIGGLNKELEGLREEEGESWSQSESGDQAVASSTGSQV
ncbi:hypothetical protein M404DRAFT_21125 [Pisolithus tinctorius Marx 270]|uniref:Uncharacterized protein n=1 Tax=Pisolithus tinctorius Marx 270 TaxID=870435 RepID=A0A0C3JP12_PISTI|nr:hypothetical protein M404DRAFT_21125 [Pisolithus tinctorius Marx 270]